MKKYHDLVETADILHLTLESLIKGVPIPVETIKQTLEATGFLISAAKKRRDVRNSGKREDLLTAEDSARKLAQTIESVMPKGWGFLLLLSSLGDEKEDGSFVTYVSSVQREFAGSMMLELLGKWKQDPALWDNISKGFAEATQRKKKNEK